MLEEKEVQKPTHSRPKVSASAQAQLDQAEKKFDKYQEELKSMSHDGVRSVPIEESEPQTKLSSREISNSKDIYLKPERVLADNQKFNERFREEYNFQKEYVHFIAENKEIIGDVIEIWTHPYGGVGAQFWKVPSNKPVWGPRYLAEQIKRKRYVRFVTQDRPTNVEGGMTYYGSLVAETQIQRLDANPVAAKKSIFMGTNGF